MRRVPLRPPCGPASLSLWERDSFDTSLVADRRRNGNLAGPVITQNNFERPALKPPLHNDLPPATAPLVNPAELPGWVRFEDERLLVIDKPGWLVVHPSKNGPWSSLAGALREGMGLQTIRFIYRLDRETSGVIILAKDEAMGSRLQKAVSRRLLGKAYVTLLEGELTEAVRVEQPLGPDPTTNVTVKSRVVESGSVGAQEATTIFHPLLTRQGFTLAGVELITGRKHQIRAHAKWLGRRVVGDKLYGPDPTLYLEFSQHGWTERHNTLLAHTRQALHCAAMDLRRAGLAHVFTAPWPADLARFAERRMALPRDEAQAAIDAFVARVLPAPESAG
jgi:23S rRNA pseudouridine1911/1915/1917 synthase